MKNRDDASICIHVLEIALENGNNLVLLEVHRLLDKFLIFYMRSTVNSYLLKII